MITCLLQAEAVGLIQQRFLPKSLLVATSYNIAQITYELNVLGTMGPRRTSYTILSIVPLSLGSQSPLRATSSEFGSSS
ncbi:tubby-like protein [Medicago truncatula]|uniref:Tubby-like protein n=1 Tax=Medicago truncatula TaxID=3880 RepID=A0A072U938_MEDTR|nr:tubby-like protein [Medicago truncatula]